MGGPIIGGHAPHIRSLTFVPATVSHRPMAHVCQTVQAGALAMVLKWPAGHAVHPRSVVALGADPTATNVPGAQSVHATHALAGIESWSQ